MHYRDLTPSVPYILDYHVLATSYDEPLIRRDPERDEGRRASCVETSKGEAGPGQHEINFRYADALRTADDHVVYKNGAKEIAHQHGCSITFMAKPYHTEVGSSCHVHSSLWRDGENAFAGESDVFRQFLAGRSRAPASWRSSSRRRSTRTSASWPGAGRRRRSPGATTTGRAASASSGTARACASRRASPAPTSTRTSPSPR